MGDRHGGRFARRGRALSPPRRGFPMARCGVPMARGGGQDLPAQERSPRRKHPDTAHERKDLPRARRLSSTKASRHGAKAKRICPRRNSPLGEGLPTRRTSEKICPARERSPRRRPPDTAHGRKNLPRAGTRPSAKASRHGARAKGFVPRRNTPLGEGLPTRRSSKRICPAQEHAPRRKPPDTAQRRKNLPRAGTRPTAKASRHGAKAKEFVPRGSRSPHVPTNGGPPSVDGQPKNTPSAGSHPQRAAAAEFIHLKK